MNSNRSRDGPKRFSPRVAKSPSVACERTTSIHRRNASNESLLQKKNTSTCDSGWSSSENLLPPKRPESDTKQKTSEAPITYHLGTVQFNYCPYLIRRDGSDHIAMFIPFCIASDANYGILREASPLPPTTLSTLAELELKWIQNNIHLRVDVNHEHDLRFMPIKGQMGQEKRLQAKMYWDALELELEIYAHNSRGFCSICSQEPPTGQKYFVQRLPIMFETLKELLALLVPDRDQDEVTENLDVGLLMQQVRHGVLDIVRLSAWLEGLLTSHCAPIRDEKAGEMREKLTEGASQHGAKALVDGLEQLFSFLEAMKLDVANHQIRTFRLLLIEETVSWQQDYFEARIQEGKFEVTTSRSWYSQLQKLPRFPGQQKTLPENFICLLRGLVEITALAKSEYPKTFTYDVQRLEQIQTEVQDIIHIDICLQEFNKATRQCVSARSNLSAIHEALKTSFMYLTDAEAATNKAVPDIWLSQVEPIAVEIDRAANATRRASNLPERQEYIRIANVLSNAIEAERVKGLESRKCLAHLLQQTMTYATQFWNLTPLQMAEKQRLHLLKRQEGPQRYISDIVDVARKLAHTGVLHWRVWERLAYIEDDDLGEVNQESEAGIGDMENTMAGSYQALIPGSENEALSNGAWEDGMDLNTS